LRTGSFGWSFFVIGWVTLVTVFFTVFVTGAGASLWVMDLVTSVTVRVKLGGEGTGLVPGVVVTGVGLGEPGCPGVLGATDVWTLGLPGVTDEGVPGVTAGWLECTLVTRVLAVCEEATRALVLANGNGFASAAGSWAAAVSGAGPLGPANASPSDPSPEKPPANPSSASATTMATGITRAAPEAPDSCRIHARVSGMCTW
jgi:hypothetical protein